MALEIPIRQFGPRISEDVSTPQINVQKFRSVADALGKAGGNLKQLGERLKKEKQDAEDSAAVTKAIQQYDLRTTQGMKDLALEMNEEGKNRNTNIGYADDVELMTQNTIEDLSANMPSDRARRIFNERITPKQTKNIIGADITETKTFRNYYNKLNGDVARQRSLGVHSLKSGSVTKAEEYLLENERMFKGGIGKLYDVAGAKANIDQFGNELAFASGEAAVRNEDIGGLEDLLMGTLRDQKIKMPGLDTKDLDKRSVSPLEKHLTPAQKNSLLNSLEQLYHKKKLKELEAYDLTKETLTNSINLGEYDPGNPAHKQMPQVIRDKIRTYRDLDGNPMHWKKAVDGLAVSEWASEVVDYTNKSPFANPDIVLQQLNEKKESVNNRIANIMTESYGDSLKNVPADQRKNVIASAIQSYTDKIIAQRQKALEVPGQYVIDNSPEMARRLESISVSDPKSIEAGKLNAYMRESIALQKSAGANPLHMDPLPPKFYEAVTNQAKDILKNADPLSNEMSDFANALHKSIGPAGFPHFAAKIKELDADAGAMLEASAFPSRTERVGQNYYKVLSVYHSAEHKPLIEQHVKGLDETNQSLLESIGSEMNPFIGTNKNKVYQPTLNDISMMPEFANVKQDILKVAKTNMYLGMDKSEAIKEAVKYRFENTNFISENDSFLSFPKNAPYTAQELTTVIDKTSTVEGLVSMGIGPKNFDELSTTVGTGKVLDSLKNEAMLEIQNEAVDNEAYMSASPARKIELQNQRAYDIFKRDYTVKWFNAPGGTFRAEFIRRKEHMGIFRSRFGERADLPINLLRPEAISGYRQDKKGNRTSLMLMPEDIGRLKGIIDPPGMFRPGERKPQSVTEKLFGRGPQFAASLAGRILDPADGIVEIEMPPIDIEFDKDEINSILDEQHQVFSTDQNYRPEIKEYLPLSEEEMDIYEQDPEAFEKMEKSRRKVK